MFKVLYWVILYWYFIKTKQNYNTLIVLREKSKIVSIASSVIKDVTVLSFTSSTRFRFPVELICCIATYLFTYIYCYHFIEFIRITLIYETTSHVIMSLASLNLWNVIICSENSFYLLIKKVLSIDHNILILSFYSWKKIFFAYFYICSFLKK